MAELTPQEIIDGYLSGDISPEELAAYRDSGAISEEEFGNAWFGGAREATFGENIVGGTTGAVKDVYETVSGEAAADAARDAAQIQADATKYAADIGQTQYEQTRQDMMPWLEAGTRGLGTLEGRLGSGYYDTDPYGFDTSQYEKPGEFSFSMDEFRDDPYYKFLQDEARRGVVRGASATGTLGTGGTLGALSDRAMQTAAGYYGQEHARQKGDYLTNAARLTDQRDFGKNVYDTGYYGGTSENINRYNRDAALSGVGQVQGQNLGNLGQANAAQQGNWATQAANAQAAGVTGAANAQQQGFWNMMNLGLGGAGVYGKYFR